jgi:hypothetical protein
MREVVRSVDVGVVWEPNCPDAILLSDDRGSTALALNAHPDDEDQRAVVLRWSGVLLASIGDPNDEGLSRHRLYDSGLKDVLWIGEVFNSETVASLVREGDIDSRAAAVPTDGATHHVVLTKEVTVDVVALALKVTRIPGDTAHAAVRALDN